MNISLRDLLDTISALNNAALVILVCMLLAIIYGNWKEVWVWGRDKVKVEQERDRWETLALRGTSLAEKTVDLVVKQ